MTSPLPQIVLTIAGHDPSSGAGITADLQVFSAFGHFGISVLTALTVQSTLGVTEIQALDPSFFARSFGHLAADLPPVGIKIGMLGSAAIVQTVAGFLHRLSPTPADSTLTSQRQGIETGSPKSSPSAATPVVLDPILSSSSGAALLPSDALDTLHHDLLPRVTWITPNWAELAALTGLSIETLAQAEFATHALAAFHPHLHIVATAGDQFQPTDILRLPSGEVHHLSGEHVTTTATHGTGCVFSSALLSCLVTGDAPVKAVGAAKLYVSEALRSAPRIGHGKGPLMPGYRR